MSKYGRRARAPSLIDSRSPWRPGASEANRLSRRRHGSCDAGDWVGPHSPQACPRTSVRRFKTTARRGSHSAKRRGTGLSWHDASPAGSHRLALAMATRCKWGESALSA